MLLLPGALLALVGLALRSFAAGFLEKNTRLATGGPYAYTRNPLYLGSFFMGLGLALAGGSWVMGLLFLAYFYLLYGAVMRREENSLRMKFGEAYDRYAESVPLFFPGRGAAAKPSEDFHWGRYKENREYEAAIGLAFGILVLILKLGLK